MFYMLCLYNFFTNKGNFCIPIQQSPSVIKYYEAGKSCYVNGTFYTKCEERLNGPV